MSRILDCCEFQWAESADHRSVRITSDHCPRCIAELRVSAVLQGIHLIEVHDPDERTESGLQRVTMP